MEVGGHHVQGTYMGQAVGVGGRRRVRRRMDVIKDGELGRMKDSGRKSWCMEAGKLRAVRRLAEKFDGSKVEKVKKQEGSPNLTRRTEWTSSRCQSRRTKQQLSSTGWSHEHKVSVGMVWCALQNFATNLNELSSC